MNSKNQVDMKIPIQLQKDEFRFVRVASGEKIPIDAGWQKDNWKYDNPILKEHLISNGNIAVVCGFGNLGVIDLDSEEDLKKIINSFPPTFTTLSGGKGLPHFYYTFDVEPKSFWINYSAGKYYLNGKEGVRVLDFKAKGGCIIIPPSKTIKEYSVLSKNEIATLKYDDFFSSILNCFDIKVEKKIIFSSIPGTKKIMDLAINAGIKIKQVGNNYQALCIFHEETNPSLTFYPETNTFYCYGCHARGDLILFEKKLKEIYSYQDFRESIFSGKELLEKEFPERNWFVENFIPEGAIVNHSGKASTLKTMTALHFLLASATNKMALGQFKTSKCNILFLDTENGLRELKKRISYICKGLDIKKEDLSNNIFFLSEKYVTLDSDEGINNLKRFIIENEINIVCVDGLKRFTGFDENDASEVNSFFSQYIRPLIIETKITFYYIMHMRKSQGNTSSGDDPLDEARGSGELVNIPDIVIFNKQGRGNMGSFTLKLLKNRLGTILPPQLIEYNWTNDNLTMICRGDIEEEASEAQNCANTIMEWLAQNNKVSFKRSEMLEWNLEPNYSNGTRDRAKDILKNDGRIKKVKKGYFEVINKKDRMLINYD